MKNSLFSHFQPNTSGVLAPEKDRAPANFIRDLLLGADEEPEMGPTQTALRPLHEQLSAAPPEPPTPDQIRARQRLELERKLELQKRLK